ncbi:MAG: hypothetical protein JSW71_14235 [Gemmatimonadota bacterium]|nr:MAG: hypothetical protein JSW71_14235 [Gemmatimonadota bacterium]
MTNGLLALMLICSIASVSLGTAVLPGCGPEKSPDGQSRAPATPAASEGPAAGRAQQIPTPPSDVDSADRLVPEIVLYVEGRPKPVPTGTRGFAELKDEFVRLLSTARFVTLKVLPQTQDQLRMAFCLEMRFMEPRVIREASAGEPPLEVLRAIIPLAGPSVSLATPEGRVTVLYIFQEQDQTVPSGPYGTPDSIAPLKRCLEEMGLLHGARQREGG